MLFSLVLTQREEGQEHSLYLETCSLFTISGPTLDLMNKNLHFIYLFT